MAADGMPLDWYCANAERALRELVAECGARVAKVKEDLDARNQLLQTAVVVLGDKEVQDRLLDDDARTCRELTSQIAKLNAGKKVRRGR